MSLDIWNICYLRKCLFVLFYCPVSLLKVQIVVCVCVCVVWITRKLGNLLSYSSLQHRLSGPSHQLEKHKCCRNIFRVVYALDRSIGGELKPKKSYATVPAEMKIIPLTLTRASPKGLFSGIRSLWADASELKTHLIPQDCRVINLPR